MCKTERKKSDLFLQAEELSAEQIYELKEAFTHFDKDGDGTITTKQLEEVLEAVGRKPEGALLQTINNTMDTDGHGTINFQEFLTLMSKVIKKKELRDMFNRFDNNKDGFISVSELHDAMKMLGNKFTDEEMDELVEEADQDGDGQVSYEG